ncbi:hypothetical protein TURU_091152 [Turdus rufiventris]|nr:hypothetical protein TURU_091152 [Turdus rufiventris]
MDGWQGGDARGGGQAGDARGEGQGSRGALLPLLGTLQSIGGTAWFGVAAPRDEHGAASSARLGSARSGFGEAAVDKTSAAAPPKGLVSCPLQREWGSLLASLLSLVKPQIPRWKRLLSPCQLIRWERGSIRGVPKAGPGFVAVVGHLGTGAGQLREYGDLGTLRSDSMPHPYSIRELFPPVPNRHRYQKQVEYL